MLLNAIETGPAITQTGAQPVVFLHGLFGEARNFGAFQRVLSARFRVIALDLRNHGNSPHQPGMRYVDMAADVLETLRKRKALPARVIGHSMGGKTAMALALSQPDAVSRLMVADIAPVPYQHHNAVVAEALQTLRLTPLLTRATAEAALASAVPDPAIRLFLLRNMTFGAQPAWRIGLKEIAAAIPDLEGWIPIEGAYQGPAWFVTGARSEYVRREDRPAIRAQFPHARFVAVKNAGHWLHADNPEGFSAVLEAFLAG